MAINRINYRSSLLVVILSILCSGCFSLQQPAVPGLGKTDLLEPVPVSQILTALKLQIALALQEIEAARSNAIKMTNQMAGILNFQLGSGTLKGTTQIVDLGEGAFTAIIPFSGLDGTLLTPKAGVKGTSTGIQATELEFTISPVINDGMTITNNPLFEKIEAGNFLRKALVGTFNNLLTMQVHDPEFAYTKAKIAVSFTVVRTIEAGMSSTVIAPVSSAEYGPSLGGSRERTGVYELSVEFPFNTPEPADPRSLIYMVTNTDGRAVLVSEPYSQTRYELLLKTANQSANIGGQKSTNVLNSLPSSYSKSLLNILNQKTSDGLGDKDTNVPPYFGPIPAPKGF